MTSSGSNEAGPPAALAGQAEAALDILAGNAPAVGLAVSGGSDSTALLVLAAAWARRRDVRLQAASLDHGLRLEAREEAAGVGLLCGNLGVGHDILTWIPPAGAVAQAKSRGARHALLADWARGHGIGVLALGHTRDDRIETFLMRARQGSGWHGLAGPLPSGPSPAWPEGRGLRLIRPLLAFAREDLRVELRGRAQSWVEDPSNAALQYERVRVRALVQRMEGAGRAQAVRVMDALAAMRAAVAAQARTALGAMRFEGGEAQVSAIALRALGAQARLRLVEALVLAAGGAQGPPGREALARVVERLIAATGWSGSMTLGGAWLRMEAGHVRVSPAPPRRGAPETPAPAWDRAESLLADPHIEALAVRGGSGGYAGEKDAGK